MEKDKALDDNYGFDVDQLEDPSGGWGYFTEDSEEENGAWMTQMRRASLHLKGKEKEKGGDKGDSSPARAEREEKEEEDAGITQVPRYVVNLDLPPEERWTEIAFRYRHDLQGVRRHMRAEMEEVLGPKKTSVVQALVRLVMGTAAGLGIVYYGKEIRGLAARTGMSVGELVMTQLAYEAAACCTSVVIEHDGKPLHFRTMDWGMDYLKGLTIEVDFQREGKTVFTACTWPGYVGVLTGLRSGAFSASVNFRVTGDGYWSNVKNTLSYNWPVGFLLREVLESSTDFASAVGALSLSKLIAPVYFTIAGVEHNEGALITRNRETEESRWNLGEHGAIVQTNIDHWSENDDDDILYSIERRSLARSLLDSIEEVNDDALWELMSTPPIFNQLTIYGCIMNPSTGELKTRLPQPWTSYKPDAFKPCRRPLPFGGIERKKCINCGYRYIPDLNAPANCKHSGGWHSTFGDCNYIKCGFGLKTDIGTQHWGCCFSTNKNSSCPKSGLHTDGSEEEKNL